MTNLSLLRRDPANHFFPILAVLNPMAGNLLAITLNKCRESLDLHFQAIEVVRGRGQSVVVVSLPRANSHALSMSRPQNRHVTWSHVELVKRVRVRFAMFATVLITRLILHCMLVYPIITSVI